MFFVNTTEANLRSKFEVFSSNRSQDMERSENFKSRSRDPFLTLVDLILHFFRYYPG